MVEEQSKMVREIITQFEENPRPKEWIAEYVKSNKLEVQTIANFFSGIIVLRSLSKRSTRQQA